MKSHNSRYHGVINECRFLDHLGCFSLSGHKVGRTKLLAGYLRGLDRRARGFSASEKDALRRYVATLARGATS